MASATAGVQKNNLLLELGHLRLERANEIAETIPTL
jgi:hypothetical protein